MTDVIIFALWTVVELIFIITGRCVVKALTLGRLRIADNNESRVFGAAGALSFKREDQRIITETGQFCVGLLFYVFLCIGLIVWAQLS